MVRVRAHCLTGWLALVLMMVLPSAHARVVIHPFEFHADAKMGYWEQGPLDHAYGYMNLLTDEEGRGLINVMFSNAGHLDNAVFNARVRFLDTRGLVIRQERFNCRMDSTGVEGPAECLVSKPLATTDFQSIEVDFYLSE